MSVYTSSLGVFLPADCPKDYLARLQVCLVRAIGYSFKDNESGFNEIFISDWLLANVR